MAGRVGDHALFPWLVQLSVLADGLCKTERRGFFEDLVHKVIAPLLEAEVNQAQVAALFFANKVGHYMLVTSEFDEATDTRTYNVVGQVFFSSSEKFMESFDFKEAVDNVVIDLSRAHFWDITAVGALDKAVIKFRREGTEVELIGLNEASATVVDRYAVHNDPVAVDKLMGGH